MGAGEQLLNSLLQFFWATWEVLVALGSLVLPWLPLIAWVAFWLLAVNWHELRKTLLDQGGWIGLVLLGLVGVLVWGVIAPPDAGHHFIAGLQLSNFVGKAVFVTGLIAIMALCGTAQLSGAVDRYLVYPTIEAQMAEYEDHAHHGDHGHGHHGHDDHGHGHHGHDDHGHH